MEKFIKDYGILILVGVAVYWFFIRKKDDEIIDVEEASGYRGRRYIPRYIQENPCGNPCAGSDCPEGTTCVNSAPGNPCGYSCEGAQSGAGISGVGPSRARRKYRRAGRKYY